MRLLILITLSVLLFGIYSCNSIGLDWDKDVYKAYENEDFDSNIIKNQDVYDTLKSILFSNRDTIFSLSHFNQTDIDKEQASSTPIYLYDWTGSPEVSTIDTITVQALPLFICRRVASLLKRIGPNKIASINMYRDSGFTIVARDKYDSQTDVRVQHALNWYPVIYTYKFKKDSTLSNGLKYYILCFYKHQDNLK